MLKGDSFRIKVRTNCSKTEITGKEGDVYRVNVKGVPEKGRANFEILKLFSKLLKKEVRIIKGFKSKEKVLKVVN